jgi:hypothetical protein
MARANGIYLIGRVVVFEDPKLSQGRPDLAIHDPDGSVWTNAGGLGWTNPYDKRVWDYNVSIAEVAARAGFDEIQFDYVRFPTDGDVERSSTRARLDAARLGDPAVRPLRAEAAEAARRRVSADVFGLSATRDLGIGQIPRGSRSTSTRSTRWSIPSHFNSGSTGIDDRAPARRDGRSRRSADFRTQLKRRGTDIIPWLQDFTSGGRTARGRARADRVGAAAGLAWLPALEPARAVHAGRARPPELASTDSGQTRTSAALTTATSA